MIEIPAGNLCKYCLFLESFQPMLSNTGYTQAVTWLSATVILACVVHEAH